VLFDVEGTARFTTYQGRPAAVGIVQDVSERKRLERDKADFLAMVTHDFKSPLTNILGYSELIMQKGCVRTMDEVCEMAASVYKSGRKLIGMVEDFLFHSRLEAGTATLQKAPGNLEDLLRGVCEEYAPQAEKKGLELRLEHMSGLPRLYYDKRLVERAVSNLNQHPVT
jgi:signal transduction histidine kinase